MHYLPNVIASPRLGLVVSKKIAKLSVHRNYMRRVLRELFRNTDRDFPNVDLVIRVQSFFSHADFIQVQQEFNQLLLKLQALKLPKTSPSRLQ